MRVRNVSRTSDLDGSEPSATELRRRRGMVWLIPGWDPDTEFGGSANRRQKSRSDEAVGILSNLAGF
jgi:hypothetical protein